MPRKKSTQKRAKRKSSRSSNQSILVIALIIAAIVAIFSYVSSMSDRSALGVRTLLVRGDDNNSGSSGSSNDNSGSGSSSDDNSNSSSADSSDSNSDDDNTEISVTKGPALETTQIRTKREVKKDEERSEVRFSEGERIRTRTKDGETRVDITSGGIKVRFEQRDDRVVIKAEQEDGTEVELEDNTLLKIDDRLGRDDIKIATAGATRFLLQKGTAGAVTEFPISIDLATNSVFVNTPNGQRMITVLPEQAIQNIIAANVVNRIGGQAVLGEIANNNLSSISQLVTLGESNGVPVYEVNGVSDQKLLGFIPVEIEKDVTISAETGEVIATDISLVNRIQDILSF